jgi:hypothetical protein
MQVYESEYETDARSEFDSSCRDRVNMAIRPCIWPPPLGQSSSSWPFAAIALVSLGAARRSCVSRCRNGTATAVAGSRPALTRGNGCMRVAVLRREHAGMAQWA